MKIFRDSFDQFFDEDNSGRFVRGKIRIDIDGKQYFAHCSLSPGNDILVKGFVGREPGEQEVYPASVLFGVDQNENPHIHFGRKEHDARVHNEDNIWYDLDEYQKYWRL